MNPIGIDKGDYVGYIEAYARRIRDQRPLTIVKEERLINLTAFGSNAPLEITRTIELINLENMDELRDPRDPRFRTHRQVDMRGWRSSRGRDLIS